MRFSECHSDVVSSLDALLLGYDIGCVSGIIPFVQAEFGLTNHQVETFAAAMNSFAVVGALVHGSGGAGGESQTARYKAARYRGLRNLTRNNEPLQAAAKELGAKAEWL